MSYDNKSTSNRDLSDAFFEFLAVIAKVLVWLGLGALLVGLGFLIYYVFGPNVLDPGQAEQIKNNISILSKVLDAGVIGLTIGLAFLYFGEETLGPLILVGSAALYFAPLALKGFGGNEPSDAALAALASIQFAGMIGGGIGVIVVLLSVVVAVKDRATIGAKKDTLKLGKSVKAEKTQNVLLGSCWQLPFCRKFVRERCPIYHSRRTCWRELTGCMCEEEIIMNAMQNKPIAKGDLASASAMIPRNHRLTDAQKRSRCKSCVIYNEHLRHKYRVTVPAVIVGYALIYVLARGAMSAQFMNLIEGTGKLLNSFAMSGPDKSVAAPPVWLPELLTAVVFILLLSYTLKLVEYMLFNLKI